MLSSTSLPQTQIKQPTQEQTTIITQFETLLNNATLWQSNPIETTRKCLNILFTSIKSTSSSLIQLDHLKASKTELTSSLNTKANIADIMRTFSEVAQNIENRPTLDELNLLLDDKVSKNDLQSFLNTKPSLNDIKSLIQSNDIKLNITNNLPELRECFITYDHFNQTLSQFAGKDNVLNSLTQKVSKDEMNKALMCKVNVNEFKLLKDDIDNNNKVNSDSINEMICNCNKRIDSLDQDIDRLIENIKVQFQNVNTVMNNLTSNKADYKEVETLLKNASCNNKNTNTNMSNQFEHMFMSFKNEINENMNKSKNEFIHAVNVLEQKVKGDFLHNEKEYNEKLCKLNKDINSKLNNINNDITKVNNCYINKNDINDIINTKVCDVVTNILNNQHNDKSNNVIHTNQYSFDYNELETFYKSIAKTMNEKIDEIELCMKEYLKQHDNNIQEQLDKKANLSEMTSLLNTKADLNNISVVLDSKLSHNEFDSLKNTVTKLSNDLIHKVDQTKFESFMQLTSSNVDTIQKDLIMKANIKEVMTYLKNKADIDEVNKALILIHDELDTKSSIEDFNTAMDNQNVINNVLCKENCVGKWMWNSGECIKGYYIPWEEQRTNTCPEMFIWDTGCDSIIVVDKGIFIIKVALFGCDNAMYQVLVNGEVMINMNENSKRKGKGFGEGVSGNSVIEFLNLESKSRISVSYNGNSNVKGFMCLQKI